MKRSPWALGLALFALAISCEPTHEPLAPALNAAVWANEPAGFVPLSDYGFDSAFSPGQGVPLGDGWYLYNPNGYATQVSDPGAPLSPPNVGQWRYPVGFVAGDAPAIMYRPMDLTRELYFAFAWKASNPWQGHPSGANEISFVIAQNNILVVQMKGPPGGPYDLMVTAEFTTSNGHLANSEGDDPGARHLFGNVNGGNYVVTPGQWYQIEVYFKMSTTSTSQDGIVRWWVNGTPVGDYTTVNFDAAHPFEEFHFSPTWGGIGGTKTEEDYFWYDHVRLSGVATSPPPGPPPPAPAPATQLAITVQPSDAAPYPAATIQPPVQVVARDAQGNTVTTFTGPVTIAIGRNGGRLAPGTLRGTQTVTAVNGVATFSDLSIDQPGSGYTLTVAAAGLTGTESAPFNILMPGGGP